MCLVRVLPFLWELLLWVCGVDCWHTRIKIALTETFCLFSGRLNRAVHAFNLLVIQYFINRAGGRRKKKSFRISDENLGHGEIKDQFTYCIGQNDSSSCKKFVMNVLSLKCVDIRSESRPTRLGSIGALQKTNRCLILWRHKTVIVFVV